MIVCRRGDFASYLNFLGLVGDAVEVGCHLGQFSGEFRGRWAGAVVHCVDSYVTQDGRNHAQDMRGLAHRMMQTGKPWTFYKLSSEQAAPYFRDASLDFVYLDASHDYANVAQDLRVWYPKVKPGGVLAGHDFINGNWDQMIANPSFAEVQTLVYGVKFAVEEFSQQHGYAVALTVDDAIPSWYFSKRTSQP